MTHVAAAAILSVVVLIAQPAVLAHAQLLKDTKPDKTGRTDEGLKIDAEIDRLYRSRAGQKTPEVRSDPWGDVRSLPAQNATPPAAKTTTKPKS